MKRFIFFILLLIIPLSILNGCNQKQSNQEPSQNQDVTVTLPTEPEIPFEPNPLTGEPLEKASHLIAVMVNNAPKARPQSGLTSADLVYEIEMEGAMTRFVAFFYGDLPENVGSVRSARPYVMMLAKEWDAYFAHVGGSDDAFAKVKEWKIRDMDDVRGYQGFWLDKNGSRPHNTYINLDKALAGKEKNGVFHDWLFVEPTTGNPDYHEISFAYDRYNRPSYLFDSDEGLYFRSINGQPHMDKATNKQIKTRNIIFQYAKHRDLRNQLLHIEVELIGEGKAEYFLGGRYQTGTWKKKDLNSPTEYFDEQGNPIIFVTGKTWIQVLRPGNEIQKK